MYRDVRFHCTLGTAARVTLSIMLNFHQIRNIRRFQAYALVGVIGAILSGHYLSQAAPQDKTASGHHGTAHQMFEETSFFKYLFQETKTNVLVS